MRQGTRPSNFITSVESVRVVAAAFQGNFLVVADATTRGQFH